LEKPTGILIYGLQTNFIHHQAGIHRLSATLKELIFALIKDGSNFRGWLRLSWMPKVSRLHPKPLSNQRYLKYAG